jgi:MFS family permease
MRRLIADSQTRVSYAILCLSTVLLAAVFVIGDQMAPAGRRLAKIAGDDPPVYFDVSHALLFHRSFDLAPEFRRMKPEYDQWTPVSKVTGHQTSPFPIGYSIMAIPFLAAGTVTDAIAGNPADGFSHYAILFYCLTNVVLTGLGLVALFTFLYEAASSWDGVSPARANILALATTCAVLFGTSVGYYAFSEMSHAATFFAGSAFLAWWWRVRERNDVRSWAILGLLAGALSLARWQDILFAGAPLLSDVMTGWIAISRRIRSRVVYVAVIVLCLVPQMLDWKFMFGKYLTVPQGSIFVFPPPFIPNVLLSSEHGWFIWTPLALLGVVGLITGAIKAPRVFVPWIAVIALEVSLIASIPVTWHSGPAFGNRYMTSSAPVVGFGMLYLLCRSRWPVRILAATAAAVCCLFSVLFAVQFRLDLIPKLDRLTPAELFTDKLSMPRVHRQKVAAQRAGDLISRGSPEEAVGILQTVADPPDPDVLSELSKAYEAMGQDAKAQEAEKRLRELLATRLY